MALVLALMWPVGFLAAGLISATLIVALMPLLRRYALARPNARSSHSTPIPQGAGIAVVAATLIAAGLLLSAYAGAAAPLRLVWPAAAVLALAVTGAIDDVRPLPPWPRLLVQAVAATLLVAALPTEARVLSFLPRGVEFALSVIGLVWFVNLTNFMDGIDGMTVAGIVPVVIGVALLRAAALPGAAGDVALAVALAGALVGFAPFNRHVARVFLGDVGSLAIGGMAGWLLLGLAGSGQLAAALILPMYYLADTGSTLFRRWRRGARLSEAHREHAYQRATAAGLAVPQVIGRVWGLNAALLALALVAGQSPNAFLQIACLLAAAAITFVMLRRLEAGR